MFDGKKQYMLLPKQYSETREERIARKLEESRVYARNSIILAITALILILAIGVPYIATTVNTYNLIHKNSDRLLVIETPTTTLSTTTTLAPTTTLSTTTTLAPTTTPTPVCPSIVHIVEFPDPGQYFSGRCIAYDDIHEVMYVWYGNSPHLMYPLVGATIGNTSTPYAKFLPQMSLVDETPSQSIAACGFYKGEFIVIGGTAVEINAVKVSGYVATYRQITPYIVPGALKGFAVVNRTRLFASRIQSNLLYEFNPITGDVISDTIPFTFSGSGNSAKIFGMSWDPITQEVYCIYQDSGPSKRKIGHLNTDTGVVTEGCTEYVDGWWSAMQFDNDGHLWLLYGDNGSSSDIGVYFMERAPLY